MSATLPFRYPPAVTAGEDVCYAALCHLGMGTGTAAVIDQRGGRLVHFRIDVIKIIHGVACVACRSTQVVDGLHHARLPDGKPVWVRDVRDVFAAAQPYANDDTAA